MKKNRYRGNNLDRIYKQSNHRTLHAEKDIDDRRVRGCLNKSGYDTELEAEVTAAKRGFRAYKCIYCPHWHLSSQPKRK